jgi:hypothetical protein
MYFSCEETPGSSCQRHNGCGQLEAFVVRGDGGVFLSFYGVHGHNGGRRSGDEGVGMEDDGLEM